MSRTLARGLLIAALALPAAVTLALVLRFGVNFPFADEWDPDIAGTFIKCLDHQVTFRDLLHQHMEHRIFIPRIIYFALAWMTGWNTRAAMIAQWFVVIATSIGVLCLARQTEGERSPQSPLGLRPRTILLWFVCNVLIFTPAAWENWLWGIGIANVMAMAFIVWILVVLNSRWRLSMRLGIAILFAAAAEYSSGSGVLAWPLGAMVLMFPLRAEGRDHRLRSLLIWIGAAALSVGLYFVGYVSPSQQGVHTSPASFAQIISYFPVFLGTPFAFIGFHALSTCAAICGWVMFAGFVVIVAHFFVVWRVRRDDETAARGMVWIAVASFSVLSGLLATMSRAGMGVDQAINSTRYVTFALYLPVGLIQLLAIIRDRSQQQENSRTDLPARVCFVVAIGVLLLLQSMTYPASIRYMRVTQFQRREGKASLLLIQILPDNPLLPSRVFPNVRATIEEAKILDERGYIHPPLIKSANASAIAESDSARIEGVAGAMEHVMLIEDSYIQASGWAAFTIRDSPADTVFLTYDNAQHEPIIFAIAALRTPRPEVAQVLGDDAFIASGWVSQFPASALPKDVASTTIAAWTLDSETGHAVRLGGTFVLDANGQPAAK